MAGYAEYNKKTRKIIGWYPEGDKNLPPEDGLYAMSEDEWNNRLNGFWEFDGTKLVPSTPITTPLSSHFLAAHLLTMSDSVVMRLYEESIPVPPEWVAYRKALRAIVRSASLDDPIPATPDEPKEISE